MILKELILRDVEIPDGYEPTGEYRKSKPEEWFLAINKTSATQSLNGSDVNLIILRKIKTWRDPVLPADAGKKCRVSFSGQLWSERVILRGFSELNNGLDRWIVQSEESQQVSTWKFCQVEDE